ncbi:hypothetical protein CYMTET_18484 [Cymbomonas tetramitiformis]|uniref:Glycosyl transferase family 3 domain-containing protein n=1 Tax=Cymbomonas tetramitiformis TaxID=36881 RepID=A0AAE0G8L9_9CHLO|nr:hypothetical protein CYMTET_18484 [Cymbomonas tetramitiformis]
MLTSLTAQVFEKEVKSYVYYCEGGPQCKMQLPKDDIKTSTCCKLRKLFTLKSPPLTTEGDPLDLIGAEPIPKNCDFAPGTECLTVLFDAQQIVSDSVSIASDWRPSSEPESLNMTPGSSGDLSSLSRRLTSTAKCGYEGPMGLAFGSRVPLGSIPAVPQAKAEGEDPMPSPGKGPSRRTARQGTAGSKGSSALPPASPLDSTSHNRDALCLWEGVMAHREQHIAPVRKSLKVCTAFNLLGPMLNPAGTKYALVGVYSLAPAAKGVGDGGETHTWVRWGGGAMKREERGAVLAWAAKGVGDGGETHTWVRWGGGAMKREERGAVLAWAGEWT